MVFDFSAKIKIPRKQFRPHMQTNKGSATVILLVILVVVLATVSVYFAFLKKPGEMAVSPTPIPTKVVKTATPTPDETANWKTYSDPQLPFSFKYPLNWATPTKSLLSTKADVSFSAGLFLEYGVNYDQTLGRPQTFEEIASQIGGSAAQRRKFSIDNKEAIEISCHSASCSQTLADVILVSINADGNTLFISNNQGRMVMCTHIWRFLGKIQKWQYAWQKQLRRRG